MFKPARRHPYWRKESTGTQQDARESSTERSQHLQSCSPLIPRYYSGDEDG